MLFGKFCSDVQLNAFKFHSDGVAQYLIENSDGQQCKQWLLRRRAACMGSLRHKARASFTIRVMAVCGL
jgi:hypothetical protein